ncbi:MAG: FecR domain-containing protein [Gemmatimonadota bacterium]
MDQDQVTDELLARHIAGESSLDEDSAVAQWVEASDTNRIEYERLLKAWSARATAPSLDVDKAWSAVSAQLDDARPVDVIPIPRDSTWQVTAFRMAAAVALIVGAVFAWSALQGGPDPWQHVAGANGLTVDLSDGTRAVLAPGATLMAAADYGEAHRTVTLTGNARFTAVHDAAVPFVVNAGGQQVRDIGTVFTVSAQPGGAVDVLVLVGSVSVSSSRISGRADTLVAGESGRFTARDARIIPGVTVDTMAPGSIPVLEANDLAAGDVLTRLAAWYGVQVTLADTTLASRPITATLSLTSLDAALDVVALLLDVTPVKDTSGIVLR